MRIAVLPSSIRAETAGSNTANFVDASLVQELEKNEFFQQQNLQGYRVLTNLTLTPRLSPSLVLRRPQAIAGDISFVKTHQLGFHHLDKTWAIFQRHLLGGALPDE